MKKIGFIDYFIDEWHSKTYPSYFKKTSLGDQFEVAFAWAEIDPEGKISLDEWCEEKKVHKANSIEEVVNRSDCLVVLSPNHAEHHEALADLPLRSGKPVYIDKTFAPTRAAAERLFEKAEHYGTPLMTSSALRFGSALQKFVQEDLPNSEIDFVATTGAGDFLNYSVHQLEMLAMVLGVGACQVMQCGCPGTPVMIVDYPDNRRGMIQLGQGQPFRLSYQFESKGGGVIEPMEDFFEGLAEAILRFFQTGQSPISKSETLEIISVYETGMKALSTPDRWIPVCL